MARLGDLRDYEPPTAGPPTGDEDMPDEGPAGPIPGTDDWFEQNFPSGLPRQLRDAVDARQELRQLKRQRSPDPQRIEELKQRSRPADEWERSHGFRPGEIW